MSFNANSPDSYNSNSKALAQRQYREKEGEGFEELQLAVHQVTGWRAIPETRHEILTQGKSYNSLDIQLSNLRTSCGAD